MASLPSPDRQDITIMIPPPNPRPASSVYSDDTSIMTHLIQMVSEESTAQAYQLIATYTNETRMLEEELTLHREAWNGTIMLANKVLQAVATIKRILVILGNKEDGAEKGWLAFWGIYKECQGSHPPWI